MNAGTPERRGYCPTAWEPMASGDGLIVRVRAAARSLRSDRVRALVQLASTYGNGQIELTRRANLQLRGLRCDDVAHVQTALLELGLAAPTAAEERRLALLVDPLAGLDPRCAVSSQFAARIERALRTVELSAGLPAKFGIVVAGSAGALRRVSGDLRIDLRLGSPAQAFFSVAHGRTGSLALGACRVDDAPSVLTRLMQALSLRGRGDWRMRDWVSAHGIDAVRDVAGSLLINFEGAPSPSRRALSLIGARDDGPGWVGLGLPFGAGDAATWLALTELADRFGRAELRMTPDRVVLLPGVRSAAKKSLLEEAARAGLIIDGDDPLTRVVACAGAPACQAAYNDTRELSRQLVQLVAPLLRAEASLHVSGCSKGCASSGASDITLVHSENGCKLGFGVHVSATSALPTISLASARATLAAVSSDYAASPSPRGARAFLARYVGRPLEPGSLSPTQSSRP